MTISLSLLALALPATILALDNANLVARDPLFVPTYGTSANGYTSPTRGWNTFGLQALGDGFVLNQTNVQAQCDLLNTTAGYTLCSIDSGWSGNGGDQFGRLVPDSSFPDLKGLADHLHSQGKELGVYILPGAFSSDADVTVEGTTIKLGTLFDNSQPSFDLRQTFDFSKDGVQQWHNSVINNFAEIGVDMIKMDFMTPGSPQAGQQLPTNTSLAAVFYHNAIQQSGRKMRLDLSWKLDLSSVADFEIWRNNADSLRTDQDINNSGTGTFTPFSNVQRAIEQYRSFINQQEEDSTRQNVPIMVHPDMDNMYTGNAASLTGLTDQERYTVAIHWIGAGANLITGSDLSQLDSLGEELLYNPEALSIAAFTANYPMQPKNPFGTTQPGSQASEQLQAWIAGPDSNNENAVVVLSNYGPDQGQGGFGTSLQGTQTVNISLSLLGIADGQPNGAAGWDVRRVWGGGGQGGSDHTDIGATSTYLSTNLGPGESALYNLTRAG
ncbi:hypothetical protein B7463_g3274, partial [Scytalidium lignicola]